jgi:hypothetical protein
MASAVITKKAGETLNLGFRYHSPALAAGEVVTSCVIAAPAGITAGTVDVTTPEVYAPISGGTAGTDYTLRYTVTTDQGQVFIDDYLVKVV